MRRMLDRVFPLDAVPAGREAEGSAADPVIAAAPEARTRDRLGNYPARGAIPARAGGDRALARAVRLDEPACHETSAQYFARSVQTWVDTAPAGEQRGRQSAAKKMMAAYQGGALRLDLSGRGLSSLPGCLYLMHSLKTINLEKNAFTTLSAMPGGLERLYCNSNNLQELPYPLPASLFIINAEKNDIFELPPLPAILQKLYCSDNRLSRLPCPLPTNLGTLKAQGNRLTRLPPIPRRTKKIDLENNRLIGLPADCLVNPQLLRRWQSDNPGLVAGNAEPQQAAAASASGHARQPHGGPPASISNQVAVGCQPNVEADRLPLSDAELADALRAEVEHYARAPMADAVIPARAVRPSAPPQSRATIPAVVPMPAAQYRAPASAHRTHGVSAWTLSAPATHGPAEAGASEFREFLKRLRGADGAPAPAEYQNAATRTAFVARVDALLDAMQQSAPLRALCLAIARESTTTCGDRITLTLADMETARIADDARLGRYDERGLFAIGLGMYRLGILDRFVSAHIVEFDDGVRDHDPVEVRLAFHVRLGPRLGLPGAARAMLHESCAELREADFQRAEAEVMRTQQQGGWIDFLVQWAPWRDAMQRRNPEAFRRAADVNRYNNDCLAILPQALSGQAQNALYQRHASADAVAPFIRSETVNFLNDNEAYASARLE